MSTALPGQRAGQRPMRAAMATQRAIGRQLTSSGALVDTFVLHTRERGWEQIVQDPDTGAETLAPYEFQEG